MSDWVHGGLLYGILLLLCTPVPGRDWPSSILTIFLRFTGELMSRSPSPNKAVPPGS